MTVSYSPSVALQHGVQLVRQHWLVIVATPLLLSAYLIYTFTLRTRFFSKMRHLPGPPHGHWLFGQLKPVILEAPGMAQTAWHEKYGPVVRFAGAFPGQETVSLTSYAALKTVLVDRAYEFPKPAFVRDVLGIAAGYGLLTLEGGEHQSLRKFMNQAFAFRYLHEQFDSYYTPINSLIEILDGKTRQAGAEGVELEVTKLIDSTLMDIICLTAFGYECDSLHNPEQPLAHAYHKLVNIQSGENLFVLFAILRLPFGPQVVQWAVRQQWLGRILKRRGEAAAAAEKKRIEAGGDGKEPLLTRISSPARIFIENLNVVKRISAELLESKMAEARQLQKASGGEFAMDVSGGKVDVLSLLVRASLDEGSPYKMDAEMLQHQMLTFLGAGHETTASGAAWAMWELGKNREVQLKLRKECQELIARNNNPGWQDIKHLKYLDAVVQETMRVRPPTPQTARQASQDSTVDGTFIAKGTTISIPIRAVNFDKKIWGDDALQFKPERWLDQPAKYNATFSVLTFIAGPHHCIGRNMAMQELKAILCSLFAHFDFAPAQEEPKETSAITMKPSGGLRMRVRRLNPTDALRQAGGETAGA